MPYDELKDELSLHYLFGSLDEEERKRLFDRSRLVEVKKGALLWSEGEMVDHIAVILRGKLKISLLDADGNEYSVKHISPVDSLGDATITYEKGHLSDVVAVEDSQVLMVYKSEINRVLNGSPAAGVALCRELSKRVENLTRELELHLFFSSSVRILYKLIQLLPDDSNEVRITHSALSDLVGMSRERLTMSLNRMEKAGVIKKSRGRIRVLDPDYVRGLVPVDLT